MGLNTTQLPASPARQGGQLRTIDPVADPLWRDFIEQSKSTVFHTPEWIGVVKDTYGFNIKATVLEGSGDAGAGLAWAELNDRRGARLLSLPFCDYAAPVAGNLDSVAVLVDTVRSYYGNHGKIPFTLRAFREDLPPDLLAGANVSVSSWLGIDLEGTADDVLARATSSARKGIRRAEREGITTRLAKDKTDLRSWFELHLRVRKYKHHLLAQPFDFFERIWDAFVARDRGFLVLTEYNGEIVGGRFCLQHKDVIYTKFSASDQNFLRMKPNNLLYAECIRESKRRGARLIDMGRNPRSAPGLIFFKLSFGAYEKDLLSVTIDSRSPDERTAEEEAFMNKLTSLFVDESVPDKITERAGEILYRNFT